MPHLSASTCATQNWMPSVLFVCARNSPLNGPVPPRAFDDIGARVIDSTPHAIADVVRARDHALGDEVRGLLRRTALPVDARRGHAATAARAATHALRVTLQPCSPDCVTQPPTTSSMRAGSMSLRSTTVRSTQPEQIGRVPAGQRALALAERGAGAVDDDGFAGHNLTVCGSPFW